MRDGFHIAHMQNNCVVMICIVRFRSQNEHSKVCQACFLLQYKKFSKLISILERAKANELRERATVSGTANTTGAATTNNNRQLLIPDESTLSRLVAARLDLPISQRLLDQNFKLSIIKRCWEDQLRLKRTFLNSVEKAFSSILFIFLISRGRLSVRMRSLHCLYYSPEANRTHRW